MTRLSATLAIVGAGPAGSLAAIGALDRDPALRVVLIDAHPVERRHHIGEALLTGTVYTLAEAGLIDAVAAAGYHRKIGAAYMWGKERAPWYVDYPSSPDYPGVLASPHGRYALHVPRHHFDGLLHSLAVARGAVAVHGEVVGVELRGEGRDRAIGAVRLAGGQVVSADYWIDASGQRAVLARQLTARQRIGSPRVARYAYFCNVDWRCAHGHGFDIHRSNIVSSRNGWFWVIHLGEVGRRLTSLGFVTTPEVAARLRLDNAPELFPELAWFGYREGLRDPRDPDGEPLGGWLVQPEYSFCSARTHGVNWALAGDAALFVDPILSQGVTLACHYGLERGRAAVAALAGDATAQAQVSLHYRLQGEILREVCSEWYNGNASAGDWILKAALIGAKYHDRSMDPVDAFRWITNLENLRHRYNPSPQSVQAEIHRRLGVA